MSEITLQINLSPGDGRYADRTVPALLAAHPHVTERLLIVDVCKPQRTQIVDPDKRFPEPAYSERVAHIIALAESFQRDGLVNRVVILRKSDPLFPRLSQRYLRPWITATHDYGGSGLMAYLAAFELCSTRYLLHYDADMLLHQAPGFDWTEPALAALQQSPRLVAATPRPAPPILDESDVPTRHERLDSEHHPAGWLNYWFSTRCFLFDLERLQPRLPLLQGRVYWESLVARWRGRGFPRSPEILLFRRMSATGGQRLALRNPRAWLLHPVHKDAYFVEHLSTLLAQVANGNCPSEQRGSANLDLNLAGWKAILE